MTPGPATRHQVVITELLLLLDGYLEQETVGVVMLSPSELELRPGTITQPDLFVIPVDNKIAGDALQWPDVKSLLLAVEVLSPSSHHRDRVTKRDFYLDSGVEEYWIVDLDAQVFERWLPGRETPELVRGWVEWAPRGCAPLVIDIPKLFLRCSRKMGVFAR